MTKRYDATLQTPQRATPKPAPSHAHLIDSDSETSSSVVKQVKHTESSDKKKQNMAKSEATGASLKVEKQHKSASGENGMEVDHNGSKRADLEEVFDNEGAGSEEESMDSEEEAAPRSDSSKPKSSSSAPRSTSHATPSKKAMTPSKSTKPSASKRASKATTPSKVSTPARPSANKSREGESSASKKRRAEHDSSDSEEEEGARSAPKKKKKRRKLAEGNEETPKSAARQSKKASDGGDGSKKRRKSTSEVGEAKPTPKRPKKVEESEDEPETKVYICNCKKELKESWYKRLESSKEMVFVDHVDKATHIIVPHLTAKVTSEISISAIAAVASGKWLLKPSWLEEIEANNGVLPETTEDFELHDLIPGCRVSRLAHELRTDYLEKKGITEDEVDDDDPELPPLLFDGWTFNLDHLSPRIYLFIQNAILDCGGYIGNKVHADVWLTSTTEEVVEVLYHERQGAPESDEALKLDHPDWKKRKFSNIHTKNSMPVWAVSSRFFTESILCWEIRDIDTYQNFYTLVHALGSRKRRL